MATRQLCAFVCIMFLLQAMAFAAQAPAPPQPTALALPDPFDPAEPPSSDPAAYERLRHAHDSCYKTVTHVMPECSLQFIRALFNGASVMDFAITPDCCHQLACVREVSCANVLGGVCVPPGRDQCPPPRTQAPASATTTKPKT